MSKLILLDRDGVINYDSADYIRCEDDWVPIPGSLEAISTLNQLGHKVAIITNQSGIARGYFSEQTLEKIHAKLKRCLAEVGGHVDAIFYCPHHPEDDCACRKPKANMLKQAIQQFAIRAQESWMVGDSLKDLQAAHNAGCHKVLVKTGNGLTTLQSQPKLDYQLFDDLSRFVESLQR